MGKSREALSADDAARVADVWTTHQRYIEAVARQHSPSPDLVPDIIQDVGVRLCTGLAGFRGEAAITSWLYRVTKSSAIEIHSREQRQARAAEAMGDQPIAAFDDPDDALVRHERREALERAIERLRPVARDAMRNDLAGRGVLLHDRFTRLRARRRLRQLLAEDPRVVE